MQEPKDSFSNNEDDEEQKWTEIPVIHSRQSSRPLEASGSLAQEEFGSAEAMEYTPSNTSQNNSIPTHLVTQSNSNLNLSQAKAGYSINNGGNFMSAS